MLPLLVVASSLFAAQPASPAVGVDVMNHHAARALEEGVYLHVAATPFKARVRKEPNAGLLEIDVVRFGPHGGLLEGSAAILVELANQSSTIPLRAPLEPSRRAGDGLIASYPVRHRFVLPEGASDVVITVVQGGSGVGLQLRTVASTASSDELPLLPLESLPASDAAKATKAATPASEPAADAAPSPGTVAADPASSTTTAADPSPSATTSADASANVERGAPPPVRFSAQVGVGGMLQLGGLSPALLSGGVRVVTGAREGWMSRYGFGGALDFEHQAARTSADDPVDARWSVTSTRLRLEAQATLLEMDLGFAPLDVTLLGGAGMILGTHSFELNGVNDGALLLGPTFRVGAQAGLRLGPGAIVALVPVDFSWDAVGGQVQGFAPLAASLHLGYRLDL